MIVVTGAYGFIGSFFLSFLKRRGYGDLVAVDDLSQTAKSVNLQHHDVMRLDRADLLQWLTLHGNRVSVVVHLGARTDTVLRDSHIFDELNVGYSKRLWQICSRWGIPFLYASSAATYGDGSLGYDDDTALCALLKPLNPYAVSKNEFDKWAVEQAARGLCPPFWSGFKFFNVFGPNEYHKGRMASVHWHFFNQIQSKGYVSLFESHRPDYAHGEQQRDFIYVLDVARVLLYFMEQADSIRPSIYNLGTGTARSYNDLARALFAALDKKPDIRYIPMPEDLRAAYQYYTQARIDKLRSAGYTEPFLSLEEATRHYVTQFLISQSYY